MTSSLTLTISSLDNPGVKRMKSLRLPKFREKGNSFLLEGPKLIQEAIDSQAQIIDCFLHQSLSENEQGQRLLASLQQRGVKPLWASEQVMHAIGTTETTPFAVASLRRRLATLSNLASSAPSVVIVAEDVQDPGNLGTIIRTTTAAGFPALILTGASADFYNPKVVRAAAGAILHCLLIRCPSIEEALQFLKQHGYQIVATAAHAGQDCFQASYTIPTVFLLGNEARGLSEEALTSADLLVRIPMAPKAESLNVAVSSAVLLYEALRQRRENLGQSP